MALIAAGFCTLSSFWVKIAVCPSAEIVLKSMYGVVVLEIIVR